MKKEDYFANGSIEKIAKEMAANIYGLFPNRKPAAPIDNSCLLVLDMQNYFLSGESHAFVPASVAIAPRIKKIAEYFKRRNLPVIYTRHTNDSSNAGQMAEWWKDMPAPGTPACNIPDELYIKGAPVYEKHQYDAFFGTSLEEDLRNKGIKNIYISGVMANLCCETTARSAFTRGFRPIFIIDGAAAYNRALHECAILSLAFGFTMPVLTEFLISEMANEN